MSLRTGAVSLLRTSRLVTSHQTKAGLARSALVFSDIQVSFEVIQIQKKYFQSILSICKQVQAPPKTHSLTSNNSYSPCVTSV